MFCCRFCTEVGGTGTAGEGGHTHAHRGKKHRITTSLLTFTSVGFFLGMRGGASRTEARDLVDELESRARKRHTAEGEGADSQ